MIEKKVSKGILSFALVIALALVFALPLNKVYAIALTIEDSCGQVGGEGAATSDIYGVALQSNDIGFGTDSRYCSVKTPTEAPDADTWGKDCYGYMAYTLSGQNLATVDVDVAAEGAGVLPPLFCYSNNTVIEVNNTIITTSSNWTRITYKYILPETAQWVRFIFSAFNAQDESVAVWMQQVTNIKIEYTDNLPAKDLDEEPAIYSDICNGNLIEGQRSDLYNLAVKNDKTAEIGDGDRIVFGENPSATECYIDYSLKNQDTVAVTAYEEILEGNTRPQSSNVVKFAYLGHTWEADATEVLVDLGDYATKRFTKLTFIYKLDSVISTGTIRLHIYKATEGQSEIQIGRVDIYNSDTADLTKLNKKCSLERYLYLKGQTNYSSEKWNNMFDLLTEADLAIDTAENSEAIDTAYDKAIAGMNAVLTVTQEFESTKISKKAEIDAYVTAKGESNYTAENWAAIGQIAQKAKTDIDAATSSSQINTIILEAKEDIDNIAVKTNEQPKTDDTTKKGCTSSAESGILLLAAAFAVVALRRTKKA